ncbi:TPA: hypothetical protein LTU30_002916 [Enterococcus faecium]|nr:hypothetical protein [Enterococcus faecium]MBJ1148064.1 hypothetical protein [Enterococcus faecium]HAQ6379969.1 hypothetical protein [Enterococcus faecium]HAQ8896430.1 hypothetical protein [Enterococcus faecium]HBL8367701.1 hypothetical protein [Enterococcus faecium]
MVNNSIYTPEMQNKIKRLVGLGWMTRGKLDSFSTIKYLLMDIYRQNKKTGIHFLGYDKPEDAPFFVPSSAYRASTSGSMYNLDLFEEGAKMIEYDFNEAYSRIMRNYPLPSNTYLKAKYNTDQAILRAINRPKVRPYENLKTYMFFLVNFEGTAKEGTYANPKSQSMFADYGENPKTANEPIWLSEIELTLILDYYDIKEMEVLDSHTFLTKKGLLKEYFERIEPLKTDPDTLKLYKNLRTKVFGAIGQKSLREGETNTFDKYSMYNRAYSSMVAGVFRDRMVRYEQKYVHSAYGLLKIRTDGLYFRSEVPEFEELYKLGVVKKKVHTISKEEVEKALEFKNKGFENKGSFGKSKDEVKGVVIDDDFEFDFD